MHIKQVIISGFRSFRNQNEIEPFSLGHNVIVGRNGAGKSNFFDAIQFVLLAPKFFNLRQEDRQQMLHEGAGSSVMAAFVEIVFDNTGDRFSTETDEVILRRTVGHKKDEFFMNKKRIQKAEVISLLETAGFSRTNPYYIVQQGRVANLCTMKDRDRLMLLKEVSGTSVYEDRRAESLKILQESGVQQERIDGLITFINDRLAELESEKNELKEYESLDKLHRALEYNIYDKELTKSNAQLEEVEQSRSVQLKAQNEYYSLLNEVQQDLQLKEEELNMIKTQLERLEEKKRVKMELFNENMEVLSNVTASYNDYKSTHTANQSESELLLSKSREIEKKIDVAKRRLSTVEPVHREKLSIFENASKEYETSKARMDQLYGKQGRNKQFSSKKERDMFLTQQIKHLESQCAAKSSLIESLKQQNEKDEKNVELDKKFIQENTKDNANKLARKDELHSLIQSTVATRSSIQENRKKIWKKQELISEEIEDCKTSIEKYKQLLNSTLPKTVSYGLSIVEQIAQELNLTGYYGPIIDIITIKNEMLRTPVEVAASNALFHIVVDNDNTASILMNELEKRKAGRLTFLPLNRLVSNEKIEYPKHPDVKSLIDVALEYDMRFDIAIKHVFGKKLLAKDLDTASVFSKKFNFDVITIDGDIVSRKGGFEGGYRDEKASRIGIVTSIRTISMKMIELVDQSEALKNELSVCDGDINTILKTIQEYETERANIITKYNIQQTEIKDRSKQLDLLLAEIRNKQNEIQLLGNELISQRKQKEDYEIEMSTPLNNKLTEAENLELQEIIKNEKGIKKKKEDSESELNSITNELDRLHVDLHDNLLKTFNEIQAKLSTLQFNSDGHSDMIEKMNGLKEKLDMAEETSHELSTEIEAINKEIKAKNNEIVQLDATIDNYHSLEQKHNSDINDVSKTLDKLLNKRSMLTFTIYEKQRLLHDLVGVSKDDLEKCKKLNEKQLLNELRIVNEKFKNFTNVNRKALDQHVSFNQQREELLNRKRVIEEDLKSIQLLIDNLDQQKEESILNTFENVKEHFMDVFSELVPGGRGELILKTSLNTPTIQNTDSSNTNNDTNANVNTDKYDGVGIRVSFVPSGEEYELHQLSGGQKALVALALIFAIQRSDPAPFYLFDELDQALDANYRAAVAKLIQKQVNSVDAPAQFITTTFRPELVSSAQKCYGIALENKVSNIYALEKIDAQRFVTALMNEEEMVSANSNTNMKYAQDDGGISAAMEKQTIQSPLHALDPSSAPDNEAVDEADSMSEDEVVVKKKARRPAK